VGGGDAVAVADAVGDAVGSAPPGAHNAKSFIMQPKPGVYHESAASAMLKVCVPEATGIM
jgi:hypothetical protein